MAEAAWFEGVNPISGLGEDDLVAYLRQVDDPDVAAEGQVVVEGRITSFWKTKPYEYGGSQIGYIQAGASGVIPIVDPRSIGPEMDLVGKMVAIEITQALISRYPGHGLHHILLRFEAGNRGPEAQKHRFSIEIRAQDGDRPPVQGQRIFSSLPIGPDGLSILMNTINVHSDDDRRLAGALQSKVLHMGLDLAGAGLGPAVSLLEAAIETVADYISKRSENKAVQSALVAIGFERHVADAPKLRQGTYVMVQAPAEVDGQVWSWGRYVFDQASGAIVKANDYSQVIDFNYVAIGVTATN